MSAKDRPKSKVELKDFAGMIEAVDSADIPPGSARLQVNMECGRMGEMNARKGYRVVTFEED